MARVTGVFCEHKRLRTSCPACKATAIPPPAANARPFVSADEREEREARRDARATRATAQPGAEPAVEAKDRRRGPGNPLMPTRKKANRNISAAEADAVKPWWVKK